MYRTLGIQSKERSKDSSSPEREELHFSIREFRWPLLFMLCATLCGWKLYFAWLFVFVILVNRFLKNKYDFIIMLTILGTSMQLTDLIDIWIRFTTPISIFCIVLLMLFKKRGIMVRLTWAFALYFIGMLWIAHNSLESLKEQLPIIFRYFTIVGFIIPVAVFSGWEFDTRYFFRRVLVYAFLFAGFFMFDDVIMSGAFLLPRDQAWIFMKSASDIHHFNISPFSFSFPRRWPQSLYIYLLSVYPIARYYKLSLWQWAWLIIPLLLSRTFTFTVGIIITYICCMGKPKQLIRYGIFAAIAAVGLYFVDAQMPVYDGSSTLRIKSSVDQIMLFDIDKADDEDLAELGSTRGAQIIPKVEHLYSMNRQWIGFGFITGNSKVRSYTIENDLYRNPEDSEEVAIGVESLPFQILLTMGYIGLIMIFAFYIWLMRIVRKSPVSGYFNSVLWCSFFVGISGFAGWAVPEGLYLMALALGVTVLAERPLTDDFAPLRPYTPAELK